MMVRQLEEELRLRMRGPSVEMQQQMEVLYNENEHLTREIAILRDTIKASLFKLCVYVFSKHSQYRHETLTIDANTIMYCVSLDQFNPHTLMLIYIR